MRPALSDSVRASLLMIASTMLFAFMIICIRYAAEEVHAFEATFFRNFFGLVFALPLLLRARTAHRCTRTGCGSISCAAWSASARC